LNTSHSVEERVILVDESDRELGTEEKLRAHSSGVLHRAFSVFVTDDRGRVLLQRRSSGKYHSAGLWSNTCCGHPRPGETVASAARRRLLEEMGIACALESRGSFVYRAELDNGLIEHELDHLFVGRFIGNPLPDPAEADGWMWVPLSQAAVDCAARPKQFTVWFPLALAALQGDQGGK
jgi:isopentenyl-diphosphate delta-isomerase